MLYQLRRLLSPPVLQDAEKTRVFYLLNIILLAAFVLGVLNTLSILLFAPEIADGLWINGVLLVAEVGMLYAARQGYVQTVAFALCFMVWLALTLILYTTGGLANALFSAYAIVITIAGILLGTRGIAIFGVLCIGTTIAFWVGADSLPDYQRDYSSAQLFTNFSTVFLTMTVLLTISARHLLYSIKRLRQNERSLEARNVELQEIIQEREKAYAAMYAAEEKYRTLFENAVEGIFKTAPNGRFLMANPALARMLGYASPDVFLTDINNSDNQLFVDSVQHQALLRLAREQGEVYDFECETYRRDRSIIWTSICLRQVSGKQGEVLFYEGTAEDISLRKQVEKALRESEARFRILFERAPLGIAVVDRAAYPVVVNRAFEDMLGYSESEIGQMRFSDFTHPDDLENNMGLFQQFWSGDIDHYQLEKRYVRKDRSDIWVRVNVSEIPDAAHQDKMIYAFVEDITEQKQAQAMEIELALTVERERVNILRQFLSDASHDLRTPLSTINTSLYLLRRSAESPKQLEYIERLELQALRIQKLLDDLFLLTRLDIAETEFEFINSDLNDLIQQTVSQHAKLTTQKGHQVALEFDPAVPRMELDGYMLNIALGHLVVNALNYSPDCSFIGVRTRLADEQAVIEIQDTGIGISTSDLSHIFERFYRADKARQAESGGSGLGLTIARKIVVAHKGTIEVESQVGQGTTFRVCLPLTR